MSKCTYNYNGVEYSELEFKKILKDLELPLSELSQEDLNLFKEHVMFIHDIQNYRLLNRYTVIHNNGYYDTVIRKVLIPVNSINKENILANIIKFKGLNPLFNLYHLFNEHTIKLIDSTPEIDSKDRLYEYRLAMLLQNNVENTWLNKLLLDLQIGINNTLNTNYDLEVIKNFLSHNINIVESQTVLPDTTESIDVESLLNQLGLDGKTEFEQEPNVEIVDFVTEIRQLANTDISNIQTQNQNKSNELIRLYRIENTNILYDESIEGIVSKREIIGQFFTDSINTVANYLKKNQKEDGINLVYVDIPKSDLDKYHVSNNEFSKTMDVESDNWIIPQSIARNYVDLSSVTKVTGNFLTLNKAKKELTEIINNLPEPKLNNNFIGNFSAEGRGTFEGDGKDKAMRNQAVGFIGELNPNKEDRFDSSTYGSFKHFNNNSIEEERYLENVPEDTSNGNKIMLALNGSIADTDILQKTKDKILELHNRGFEFLVGDMPGGENRIGDDKFIDYLKSIGANFTVFGSGNNSRILYQRVGLTEQQRKNIQELKQLEPAYAVASDEKVQEFIDTIYPDSKIKNLVFRGLSNKSDIVVNNNSYWTPSYRLAEDYIDRQQSTWENLLLDNNQNVEDIPDEKWNSFQPVLQIAVINSQNPYYNNNSVFELDNYENYDTTVGMVSDVQGLEPQILVYSKKQITILNSPETINRFNEFIGNTNPLINEKSLEEAKLPINVEKLFEDEKFANEVYESLGYKNDTTLPDDNKVHKILSDINKQHHLGNIIDLDGYPIYNSEDIIFQNGLKNITSNQWGHGATRIPYGKKGIERLENILSKSDRFTGDFGPIAGTELAKINQYPNTWESGRFIITRDDKDFYDKDGSLNINNIEIILNRSFEPYGNYLANKYPNIIFKDVFGNIIKISNQLTPKQKQEAIHLYSQYLKQNPNGDVENFKSWIEEFKNEIYESLGYDIRQLEEDNMITNLFLEARQDEDNKRINSGEFDDTKLDLKVELQDIIDNSTNPLLVELARSIQYNKSLNSIKAFSTQKPFITSDGFQPAAAYQAETQRLILFLGNKSRFANKERKYQYLLHELVHHFVDRQLILTYSSHANNIKELFKYAKDELTKLGKKILYGLQNAHEFVTEALTNPDFQRELKNLKVSDKFLTKVTSLFDYLLELISNILGTNQSVLEAVITQASDIFEIQEYKKSLSITPEQKQEALSLYSKYVELNPNGNIEEFKSWVNEFNNMTKLQGAYDFSASSNSGKWNSANNELFSLVQDNRRSFFLYKFLIGEVQIFKEIVDYLNENGFNIPYTDRMIRADETMTVEERQSAIDSYNNSVSEKIDNKNQVEKNILFENNLYDETEYTPQELIEKYPLTGVQKVIWNLIKDVVNKLGIKIKFSSSRITESFDGSNNPQNGEILIRPSTLKNGRFGEVLVHEIVHALTTKIISRVNRGVTTGLTKKQISAVKGLMKLYEAVEKDNNLVDKYPVKDVFEFIAHLTNETFVKELESKDKNFLQKIVDFILDILGINNANELAKKYLLDIISDGTFLQENGITILPSDYGNNLQGSLSDFISQKSQEKKFEEKKVQIENEIKKLPIEIFNTIEIVDKVPLEILGRNDLYLSLKEILNEKNIKDELLINWLGIKKDTVISAKEVKSENHLLDLIKNIYDKKTDVKNHIELQSNQLASESFSKWVTALDKYPLPFKELMLSHAIKHLNPQRRSKYVLQLSEIALTNTFGMIMNKPYELNRVGKLYDQEVIKTVSDAVGHEPSASGKGYWVHIPRMEASNKNTDEYKKNRELLRKLSPSTWCTATTHTDFYLTKYDNYLLIVDGITVVGIEASKIGSNGKVQVKEVTSRNNNDIASIDHLEDTIAFFEKHNLDLNNSSIKSAIELKNSNITDSHFLRTVGYGYIDDSDVAGLNRNRDLEIENRIEEQIHQEIIQNEIEASTLNNLEDVWTFLKRGYLETSAFPSLQIQFRNNYEIAKFSVEDNPHSIIGVEEEAPFYLELAKIAVEKTPQVYTYLNEKAKENLNIKGIYENYTKKLEEQYIDLENINDDLPFSKTNENLIQGYYDVRNDKVVIVVSNTPIEEAAKIAIHEVSHRGIISMMRLLDKATDEDINKMIKEGIIKKECK